MERKNKVDLIFILVILITAIFLAKRDITVLFVMISFIGIPVFNIVIKNKNTRRVVGGIYVVLQLFFLYFIIKMQ